MNKFSLALSLCLSFAAAVAQADTPVETKSFGKRVPTVDEIRNIFAPKPASSLMSMGAGQRVKRAIDLELLFAFASADLTSQARKQLAPVGEFLQSAQLGSGEFVIEGHTDAVGAAERNQSLSERRAASVRNFLVNEYKISPAVFSTAGKGSTQLKDSGNPNSEVNRRVEFSMYVAE